MSSLYRGVAIPSFTFGLISVVDASPITVGTVNGYISKDGGAQVELVNSAGGLGINHLGNGQWVVNITKEETDASQIGLIFIHAFAVPANTNVPLINAPTPLKQTLTPGDPSTEIGKVRILIEDTGGIIFIDAVIQFLLDENEGDIYYAAADGLDVMAAGASQNARMVRTGSTTQDYRRTPVELRNQADRWRSRGDDFPQFARVERDVSIFSAFEIYSNRIQREG